MIPYKDDNPTTITPYVTISLITLNVLVFLLQSLGHDHDVFYRYGVIPAALLGGEVHMQAVPAGMKVFTSMFMHGGLFHLGGNMLYLWIFGDNIEDSLGHLRFGVYPGFLRWEPFGRFLYHYSRAAILDESEVRALPDYVHSIWLSVSLRHLVEKELHPAEARRALGEVLALGDWAATNDQQMVDASREAIGGR